MTLLPYPVASFFYCCCTTGSLPPYYHLYWARTSRPRADVNNNAPKTIAGLTSWNPGDTVLLICIPASSQPPSLAQFGTFELSISRAPPFIDEEPESSALSSKRFLANGNLRGEQCSRPFRR
ncbi:hypothetical protein F5Y03DRAFT_401642 [Xylaria venustula]|nr:hypothetical protein F5Y03DRAFT_401642 [Xylaria venustula]